MKSLLNAVGVILIIIGIAILGYKGFTYTKQEKVAQLGSLELTAEQDKTVYFSPTTGALALAAGVALVLVGRNRKN